MKILYGIQLNGNGHVTRSIDIIKRLKSLGNSVDVIVSGNNSDIDPDLVKYRFTGLNIYYNKSGSINWIRTLFSLKLLQLIKDVKLNLSGYDLVISDFEPISAWSAKRWGVKSIGLANQYSLICKKNMFQKFRPELLFIRFFAPCDEYISLSYQTDCGFYQPFISDFFLDSKVEDNKFFLIYLPSYNLEYILTQLKNQEYLFKIYTNETYQNLSSNIEIKKLNKINFQNDMLKCSGVITASGFSTTSEALILNKKLWSIPLKYQYEQKSNATMLEKMGIFTSEFNQKNLKRWIEHFEKINYVWSNPVDDILLKIKQIYEN